MTAADRLAFREHQLLAQGCTRAILDDLVAQVRKVEDEYVAKVLREAAGPAAKDFYLGDFDKDTILAVASEIANLR